MPNELFEQPTALTVQEPSAVADGFYEDMPFEQYAAIPALNGSSLVHLRRSPMYYKFLLDNPQPPSPAMILGTHVHRLVLEPGKIGEYAVWGTLPEEKVRRGQVWDAFQYLNKGATIVTVAERDFMVGTAAGARKNAPIMKYAGDKGRTELVMVWTDPVSKRRFKGRIDKLIIHGSRHTIFDLKTTRDCQRYAFGSQSFKLGYHIKMGLYCNGYQTLTGIRPAMKLGAIDSKPPHESAVYRVTDDILIMGMEELDALLKTLAECEESGIWPAAEPEETDLQLPTWATTQTNDGDLSLEGLEIE